MLIGLIHNLMKVACRVGPDTVPDAASVPKVNVPGVGVFENCLMNSINSFELPPSLPRKQMYGAADRHEDKRELDPRTVKLRNLIFRDLF